jgi:hypothetical protein
VNLRDDEAATWHHVGRITRISDRGVDAVVVLQVDVRLSQSAVIAKDTAFGHGTGLLGGQGFRQINICAAPAIQVAVTGLMSVLTLRRPSAASSRNSCRDPGLPECTSTGFPPGSPNSSTRIISPSEPETTRVMAFMAADATTK